MLRRLGRSVLFSLVVVAGLIGCTSGGALKMPAVFSDHMVLQSGTEVTVWGWASPGQTVTVLGSWMAKASSTAADEAGRWKLPIPTPDPGGPYTLTIKGSATLTFRDVLIGEVWLCSGQSNMEMPLRGWPDSNQPILGSDEAIAAADLPEIRLFTVARRAASHPEEDCEGTWSVCSPETASVFSAAGYFFGRKLHDSLGMPIGLIHSSWGGTPSEAWTSAETLSEFPQFRERIERIEDREAYLEKLKVEHEASLRGWLERYAGDHPDLPGISGRWMRPELDERDWEDIQVPRMWDQTRLGIFLGAAWFRTGFERPDAWRGRDLVVELGAIDEMDVTWLNGREIGRHLHPGDYGKARSYPAAAGMVRDGWNYLVIRVMNTNGLGGFSGEPDDLRIFPAGDPAQALSLSGNWRCRVGVPLETLPPMPFLANPRGYQYPTVLYNGMIHPLRRFAIKGAVWYQGESNTYDPGLYARIFPAMIRDWRSRWGRGDFPFYFVQIAPYTYGAGRDAPGIREAQRLSLETSRTGMAVTMDIGSARTIHPPDKTRVGERLALWALARDYGRDLPVFSGPLYRSMTVESGRIRLYFDHIGSGLEARGGTLDQFEIAGPDGKFLPADAIIDGETVVVSHPGLLHPQAVRYAWEALVEPRLFNREGLPASPFRTDGRL